MADLKSVTDKTGRVLGLRELEADEMLDLIEAAGISSGNGGYMAFALVVASVSTIDGVPLPRVTSKELLRRNAAIVRNVGVAAASAEMLPTPPAEGEPDAAADEQTAIAKN